MVLLAMNNNDLSVDKNDSLNGFNLRDEVVVLLASFIFIEKLIHKLTKFDCSI